MVGVSALTGAGLPDLLRLLDQRLATHQQSYEIALPVTEGAALSWLYAHGHVTAAKTTRAKTRLQVELAAADYGRFVSRFGYMGS